MGPGFGMLGSRSQAGLVPFPGSPSVAVTPEGMNMDIENEDNVQDEHDARNEAQLNKDRESLENADDEEHDDAYFAELDAAALRKFKGEQEHHDGDDGDEQG
jgi:hypothetical protein